VIEPVAYMQNECFAAGVRFATAEGIIPAPEATHAIRAVEAEVEAARAAGESRTILFNLCGHGYLELGAYQQYLNGELVDSELPQEQLDEAAGVLAGMPSAG
jgi:tryptophan synthase beta chain